MGALAVDVTPILERIGGDVTVDTTYELPELVVGDETFTARGPACVHATVTNTGAGFVAQGDVSFAASAQCARCLREFPLDIVSEVEGFFVRAGHDSAIPEDQEYGFVEGGAVDLGPAVEAALALEAPFAPLHDPECLGLCPECGTDLNEGPCGCPPEHTPGPFDALRGLVVAEDASEPPGGEGGTKD